MSWLICNVEFYDIEITDLTTQPPYSTCGTAVADRYVNVHDRSSDKRCALLYAKLSVVARHPTAAYGNATAKLITPNCVTDGCCRVASINESESLPMLCI